MKTGFRKHGSRFSDRVLGVVNALHGRRLLLAAVALLATTGSMKAQMAGMGDSGKMPPPVMDHQIFAHVLFDQFEGRSNGSQNRFRWDGEGWIGMDRNRLWFKSEGFGDKSGVSDGDHEVLYDRPIPHTRYFDAQAGVRADLDSDPSRVWAAIGIEGLAPYFFQLAPTFYIRNDGHVAGRINASYDVSLSQRFILQPQAEVNFYSKDDPARKIGSGFSDLDAGIRLRYMISRKFSPYIGYTYNGKYGGSADYARAAGELPPHRHSSSALESGADWAATPLRRAVKLSDDVAAIAGALRYVVRLHRHVDLVQQMVDETFSVSST